VDRPPPLSPLLGALAGTLLFCWPSEPGLLGTRFGEVHNHLWEFAQEVAGLQANFPGGWDLPLMDPPNLPFFALGWLHSPVAAENAIAVGNVLLGALGGWRLGRAIERLHRRPRPVAPWVGMAAVAWSPFLGGAIEFGVTESWPLGWFALHLAEMVELRRRASAATTARAGLFLGIFALSGWYHALFAAICCPLVAAWVRRPHVFAVALVAAAIPLPRFLDILGRLDTWRDRAIGLSHAIDIVDRHRIHSHGADLLDFLPTLGTRTPSHASYLGVSLVLLAALAARRSFPFLLAAVPLWLQALGHWLRIDGRVLRIPFPVEMPAGFLVEHSDTLRMITHWDRAAGPASVLLAAAAVAGATAIRTRARLAGPALALVILVDSLALSPTRWPRVAHAVEVPGEVRELIDLAAANGPGPVLDLPIDDNKLPPETATSRRPYWLWQAWHRLPVAEHYEGYESVLRLSGQARRMQSRCGGLPSSRAGARDARKAADSDPVTLRELGFRYVVVHRALAPTSCAPAVESELGAPHGSSTWVLD
jgi:hypothetical protein